MSCSIKSFASHVSAVFAAVLLAFFSISVSAQTLTLNDGTILRQNPNRIGLNIGAINYFDNGQILKNLIGSTNPGFEPLLDQQIWVLASTGTTAAFTIPDKYDTVPPNYWQGGTFAVVESQSGGAELGCKGTITSNTGPNYPEAGITNWIPPIITSSSPCEAAFSVGDVVIMSKSVYPTPESWWESGARGGVAGTVKGGAKLLSVTSDLCTTCGSQAINLNAAVQGSSATVASYFDSDSTVNIFVLMNGTYQFSFWAKSVSGNPVMTASARRISQGGFNCGSYTPQLTSSWAQYKWTCTARESAAATVPGPVEVSIHLTNGSADLDNISFEKTASNPNNTSVLRDEVIETLQNYYGPSTSNPGMFRYWVNQNAENMNNWTQPDYAHAPTSGGTGYFVGPNGAGTVSLSLEDYLVICRLLNTEPYLEVPVTFSTTDAANLIDFLASPSDTTTYAGRRVSLGQSEPWTTVFSKIHLAFCNECWNWGSFSGQSLPWRSNAPNSEYYYDYSVRARDIFAAMRADSYYSAASFDLVMNAQTAVSWSMDTAIQKAHPDSIEIEDYTYSTVSSFSSDAALWQPAMVEPYESVTNPSDVKNFYQSVHDYQSLSSCGASGTAKCNINIYEWGQDTTGGGIDQTHLDYINAGAGEGVVMALQPLLNLQHYGIGAQSLFALTEYKNPAPNSKTAKLWGNVVDMGGATNNVRPSFLGVSLVNQSIIGPMYSCPITSNATYNFAGSPNGSKPLPELNNVPYLYSFCFENGARRSMVMINTDISNSHTISFAGTNPPLGVVIKREFAPASLNDLNEAPTGTPTNRTPATVSIHTSSLSNPHSIALPPFSVIALDWTLGGEATVRVKRGSLQLDAAINLATR